MQIKLRGKNITVKDDLYDFMTKRFYEFDERDCKCLIAPVVTTGDFEAGFNKPDIEKLIDSSTEQEVAELLEKGILLQKEFMR